MSEPARRLFFALWPTDELRRRIEHETRHAARHSGGRTIPADNLHITLAFLGAVGESRLPDVLACGRTIDVRPFEFALGKLRWWPRQERLCLEPGDEPGNDHESAHALAELVGRLRAALHASGFEVERRPFRAHVTLARDVRREHEFKPIRELRWQVERIDLIESHTGSRGSRYEVLSM